VRTSIIGPIRTHTAHAFDTTVVTEKFSMRCHNPLNVGFEDEVIGVCAGLWNLVLSY
jgi:hypothetical protein